MKLALILENIVVSVTDVETEEQVQALAAVHSTVVDITEQRPQPEAGWVFNGNTLVPGPNSTTPPLKITRLAFRNRFTSAEKGALYTVAATSQGVGLRIYLDDLASSTYVDLSRPDTIASVNYLATIGLITSQRAQEILTTPLTALERYYG